MDIDQIVDAINRKINIPILPEAVERIIIEAVVRILIQLLSQKRSQ